MKTMSGKKFIVIPIEGGAKETYTSQLDLHSTHVLLLATGI